MRRRTAARAMLVLALLIVAVVAVGSAAAQDTPVVTDNDVNAIAKTLYCPVCENIPLDTCPTAACEDWRYEIRLMLEDGFTSDEIKADFVRRFGDRVVGTPYDPVLRALSFLIPVLAAVGVVALVVYLTVRARRTPSRHRLDAVAPAAQHDGLSLQERLRAEIERDIAR
ncbi:MAG: cytochrome c-type biogenesis protein CcmH [Chloroflexi bacterium]|nr:cytochrome c-type biogenesis protein CcmH [Chloroflexota bacterium]